MGRKKIKNGKNNKREYQNEAEEKSFGINLSGDVKRSILAVILFAVALLSILGFFHSAGSFGEFLNKAIAFFIGWVKFIFPLFLIIFGVVLLLRKETIFYVTKIIGLTVAMLSLTGFFHWFFAVSEMLAVAEAGKGGGYIGYGLTYFLKKYLGTAGSFVILSALLILGIILVFNFSIVHFLLKFKKRKEEERENEIETELIEGNKKVENALIEAEVSENLKDKVEKNIGKIEFVEGRDQFVSPEMENNKLEENFPRRNLMNKKAIDSGIESEEGDSFRKNKNSKWIFPMPSLLEKSYGTANGGDIENNFIIIEKTLKDFGIDVERGGTKTGPSVTQYSFRPAVGVKIAKILALQNDLSLALAAHPIRIEAPIPGQALIGIEIPNKSSLIVRLRDMIEESLFKKRSTNLTLVLGKDVSGNSIFGDLTKMPHLMIAGATGTGKSVCINTIIASLLYQNSPEDLKFIMIDPKRVELSLYNGIPHLLTDVVVENAKVVNALKWAVGEMERRYKILQETGSRDLSSYKEKLKLGHKIKHTDPESGEIVEEDLKILPYIVIVIDELSDLMGTHRKEVEGAIVRIAQMARAVGIHLIVSTQRPSVEVITGLIKANITTRIAFQVATQIDSRTILDMGGAEKLLGNGDMLYLSATSPKPRRIQAVFISEAEVKKVVEFIKKQKTKDEKENEGEDVFKKDTEKEIFEFKESNSENGEDGELLKMAKEEISRSKKASASFLQRRLRIGYARAARLLDMLEDEGIIGPADGAKPREIYALGEKDGMGYTDSLQDQEKRDKWQI